ncbi:MAG: Si-specific NAD(P)(+) transhydrogenase, partial [Actinobacteria bacterium]|nr:Si-specific NAD(P)(+) transhydrogenase [Actinomycetota bacterium]
MSHEYELLVVGSGPAGQKAAIQAAKLRKRVVLVERKREVGGASVNTGTIPSKTIREAILYLTGLNQRAIYGQGYRLRDEISVEDLAHRTRQVVERERSVVRDQLLRNHVQLVTGTARFTDSHTMVVSDAEGSDRTITADTIVLAVGSAPAHPTEIEFNGRTILDSDDIVLRMERIPSTLLVVGAGVIGIEFASMFAALGTKVTVVDERHELLDFCDHEVTEALRYHLRDLGVTFRFGERVTAVVEDELGTLTSLASGKQIPADAVFYSAGRQGATDGLELANAGLEADRKGRIEVDERYQTAVDHIYAVGDVIGFPSLASTSAEQGRLAAADAFGVEVKTMPELLPFGIYSIPEISYVGKNEHELTEASIPYEVGIAHYRELARGHILGESHGIVKLLVSSEDRTVLGVHAFGAGATEVVHIGQAVMGLGGTIDYLVETVFNYPTLAEAYKVAALDAVNKLRAVSLHR